MNYHGPGEYEHYKGGRYQVIGLAIREESKDIEGGFIKEVIYRPLTFGSLLDDIDEVEFWSRQLDDFDAVVEDGVPRFVKVAPA